MKNKSNISSKKTVRLIGGALLIGIFFVALVAASSHQSNKTIASISVNIMNENTHSFVQKKDVEDMIKDDSKLNIYKATLNTVDLNKIEKTIERNPWIVKAEVYIDNEQQLNVAITQRVPSARVFYTNGGSAYIDSTLRTLPLSNDYAYEAPVFTNVPFLGNDSFSRSLKSQIVYLSNIIAKDTFWNAQITQIAVMPDKTFVLIPLVGSQQILFGDTANANEKLDNLFAFYKNVSNKIGWDKYQKLDLRFKDQIVASPAIGYVPPKVSDSTSIEDNKAEIPVARTAPVATVQHADHKAPVKPASANPVAVVKKTTPAVKKANTSPKTAQKKTTQPKYIYQKQNKSSQ